MEKREGIAEKERTHFDRLAREVGEAGSHRTTKAGLRRVRRRGRMLAELLADFKDPYVLEIGAGAGAFSQYLLEEMPDLRFVGGDISPKCIEIAQNKLGPKYANATFKVTDCASLEWDDNTFDCVCGCSILHHLPVQATLNECFRTLNPGGVLWFSEPNMMNPQIAVQKNVPIIKRWLEDTEDETAFFRWPIAKQLSDVGFIEINVKPFDFLHPSIPDFFVDVFDAFATVLEKVPVLNEIAGSLFINARKPRES